MKKLAIYLGILLSFIAISQACSKDDNCGEESINFTSTPAINSTEPPSPGPDFGLTVNITNMTTSGATIVVTAKPEDPPSATPFFNQTVTTTTASNNFTITGTPLATSCIVTVTVTSKSCASNTKTGTYRYSRK